MTSSLPEDPATIVAEETFSNSLKPYTIFSNLCNEDFTSTVPEEALISQHGYRNQIDLDDSSNNDEQFERLANDLLIYFHKLFDAIEIAKIGAFLRAYIDKNVFCIKMELSLNKII
ncbi:10020_t:CDS:2 [Ambispora gerdemannii]|uniref:10020_t:CDS:1 n=1 Tax=Ambispora gerdemannii TaxID=144530 RepID=A0A9N8VSG6_9GLOM|nr:10020_t:CDS:2 [Ambispora gerdemannii]